jgi:hypothetical protein
MKVVSTRKVRQVLREKFNLRPRARMDGTGHETWECPNTGRTCRPVLRKKDVGVAVLYSLGLEMMSKGLCDSPKDLIRAVLAS